MMIELINTGAELLLGRVLNSHQQWLGQRLADLGYPVNRQVVVADSAGEIERAVQEALARADLVITTGGLGPTSDDLTRGVIARMLGRKLHEDEAVLAQIKSIFHTTETSNAREHPGRSARAGRGAGPAERQWHRARTGDRASAQSVSFG